MQLKQIARDALLKPLQAVSGIVERRHTLPILANVLIEPKDGALELTALNFAQTPVTASFASSQFAAGARLIDAATGADVAVVDDLGVTTVPLEPLGALALVLR